MSCDDMQLLLGAYVLGAAEPADEAAVLEHLPTCPTCRQELRELEPLIPLLGLLQASDVERLTAVEVSGAEVGPSPALLQRVLGAAEGRRRRKRWLVSAAAAAVLVTGAGALALETSGNAGQGAPVQASWTAHQTGAQATAMLTPTPSGTAIDLTLTGVPAGTRCSLVVRADDGSETTAASWQADYVGSARVTGFSPTPLGQIDSLSVVTSAGTLLDLRS